MNPVVAAVRRHAAERPGACALTDGNRIVTYAALNRTIDEAARNTRCERDATVAIALDNGPAWAVADLALLSTGRPCLPLPAFFSAAQQAHALQDAGARRLLTDRPEYYASLLRDNGIAARRCDDIELAGSTAAQFELAPSERPALPGGTIKVTYTSGTTGSPKGVCLDAATISAVTHSLVRAAGLGPDDRHLAILPLSTLLENIAGLHAPLTAGACVVVQPLLQLGMAGAARFCADTLAHNLQAQRPTTAIMVPELLAGVCAALERGAGPPAALRFLAVGGARVSAETLRRAACVGLPAYEGYGLSECASVVALNTPRANRPGSVGRVLPHAHVDVAADGEILVRGATLLGYTGGTAVGREWYATGDVGYVDSDGFVYVTGRKKNVFITSYGRNVAPEWIESELSASEAIAQAWVHGEGRPWNVAVITPEPGASAGTVDAAVAAANLRLPDYARIRLWVRSTEAFSPANGQLTANGRLRRAALLASYGLLLHDLYTETGNDVSR